METVKQKNSFISLCCLFNSLFVFFRPHSKVYNDCQTWQNLLSFWKWWEWRSLNHWVAAFGQFGSLQPSLLLRAWLKSEQVAQGFIQQSLENPQEFKLDHSGQPAVLLGCPCGSKGLPYIQAELLSFQCDHCLLSCHHCKEPDLVPWELPCKVPGTAVRFPEAVFAPGWTTQLLHVVCTGQVPSWWPSPGHAQEMFIDKWNCWDWQLLSG